MFPQKTDAGWPELARAAVARITGVTEDLSGRFTGVEVRLGVPWSGRQQRNGADHPWQSSTYSVMTFLRIVIAP
jgi:hypothetical protein